MNAPLCARQMVVTLAETGMPTSRIIAQTGIPRKRVYRWIDQAWQAGRAVQPPRPRRGIIVLSGDTPTRARLKAEATRRGLSETQLIDLILGTVAKDDLFNAILEGAY